MILELSPTQLNDIMNLLKLDKSKGNSWKEAERISSEIYKIFNEGHEETYIGMIANTLECAEADIISEIEELQDKYVDLQESYDSVEFEHDNLEQECSELQRNFDEMKRKRTILENENIELKDKIKNLEEELFSSRDEVHMLDSIVDSLRTDT